MGDGIKITYCHGLNRTPALPLAVRGWMDLIEQGHCSNYVQIKDWHDALLASIGGTPVGVLTYCSNPDMKEFVVGIGYVCPDHRGRGIYARLWNALVARAQAEGIGHISSATFLTNEIMRRVARAQGRVERTVTLDYIVPDTSHEIIPIGSARHGS